MPRPTFLRLLEARDAHLRKQAKEDALRRENAAAVAEELANAIRAFTAGRAVNLAVEGNKVFLRHADDVLRITVEEAGSYLVQHLARDGSPVRDSALMRGMMQAEPMIDAVLQWLSSDGR